MKKFRFIAAALIITLLMGACAHAETKEAELRATLEAYLTEGELKEFFCDDFDGDGVEEAFGIVKIADTAILDVEFEMGEPDENGYVKPISKEIKSDLGAFALYFVSGTQVDWLDYDFAYRSGEITYDAGLKCFRMEVLRHWGNAIEVFYVANGKADSWNLHQVRITGDHVKLRETPSLNGDVLAYLEKDDVLRYRYEMSTDERGVDWYRVDKNSGWVSSRYAQIEPIDD